MYCNCLYNNFLMVLSFEKKPSKRSEKKGEGFRQAGGPHAQHKIKQEQKRGQI